MRIVVIITMLLFVHMEWTVIYDGLNCSDFLPSDLSIGDQRPRYATPVFQANRLRSKCQSNDSTVGY